MSSTGHFSRHFRQLHSSDSNSDGLAHLPFGSFIRVCPVLHFKTISTDSRQILHVRYPANNIFFMNSRLFAIIACNIRLRSVCAASSHVVLSGTIVSDIVKLWLGVCERTAAGAVCANGVDDAKPPPLSRIGCLTPTPGLP